MPTFKLNYGCGRDYRDGFINVDHSRAVRTDLCGDIYDVRIAYGDNAFSHVLLKHVFEHIEDQMTFMERLYAVCAPDALVEVYCPYWSSSYAWADPDHKHAISENTYHHFDRGGYLWGPGNPITPAGVDNYLPACDFLPVSHVYCMAEEFAKLPDAEQEYARKHLLNSVHEIRTTLRVIKPGRV